MEYLQFWLGKKPEKKLMKCIESVRNFVTKGDIYTLIAERNFLKDSSINYIQYSDYLNELIKNERIKKLLDIIDKANYRTINTTKSDIIRYSYACNHTKVFYLDTDVKLKQVPIFDDNKVYFTLAGKEIRTTLDSFIFYNGNNTEFPKLILDRAIDLFFRKYERDQNINSKKTKAWIFNIINDVRIRKQIEKIDQSYFDHLANSVYED